MIALLAVPGSGWTVVAGTAAPNAGPTGPFAPLHRPGPSLDIRLTALRSALACSPGVRDAIRNPILLVPGTYLDPGPNFSWNYERLFTARRWPYCAITLPHQSTGDIQVA